MDCSPLSSFVLGIFQSRILGWVSTFKKTPGDLLDPGIEHESLVSPALAGKFFTLLLPGKPHEYEWQPFNKCWLLFCYYMEVRLVLKKLKMKKIIKIMQIGFPDGSDGKEYACNARHPGLIPGSGRSLGEGNGNPPQYPCLENQMDRGAWQATVHGLAKSKTRLSDFIFNANTLKNHVAVTKQSCGSPVDPQSQVTGSRQKSGGQTTSHGKATGLQNQKDWPRDPQS